MRWPWIAAALVAASLLCPGAALAQQTREEAEAAAQAAKAANLHPYVPSKVEAVIDKYTSTVFNPPLVLPYIGSTYPGGSTAFGAIVRRRYTDGGLVTGRALWSLRDYVLFDAVVAVPRIAGRVNLSGTANWLDAPEVSYWGMGPGTPDENKTFYAYTAKTVGGVGRVALSPHVGIGGGLDYMIVNGSPAHDRALDAVLAPVNVEGDVKYLHSNTFLEYDWRESPGYTSSGGLYRVDWSDFAPQNGVPFSFQRTDIETDQFLPIRRGAQVVALRALASITTSPEGDSVPYFMLPALGGSSVLRGYPSWRFRDRNRFSWTAEYRWEAGRFVDMALFYDAGTVAARVEDLDLTNMTRSFGGGIRLHMPTFTAVRLELAQTREGLGFVIAFGPSF
ncbi:MAG TPA: BamA/TamA family outer membrane protein [Vicinamibacterales bacterium]|jgi:hypothetical protein|nr:BamA/TamA family outer membrane protein [Vicinamibacterales bacterium]